MIIKLITQKSVLKVTVKQKMSSLCLQDSLKNW